MKNILLLLFLVTVFNLLGQNQEVQLLAINLNDNDLEIPKFVYTKEYQMDTHDSNLGTTKKSQIQNSKYLVRSTLGMNGTSKTIVTNSGNFIYRHSIGQKSVIGTFTNGKYTIRQGFQQPLNSGKKVQILPENQLNAKLYPNPFQQSLNVSFDEKISNDLIVVIYNLPGKVLFLKKYPASQRLILPLGYLTKGNYILKITADNKQLLAKLIKL